MGGGTQPPELVEHFLELAGGPGRARIAVLPMASGSPESGPGKAAQLRAMGAEAVVGGTSAGAAVMSDSMLTGAQFRAGEDTAGFHGDEYPRVARGSIPLAPAFGFVRGALVDQHFLRRERHNRLLSVVLERPWLLGVGIDGGTALRVDPDGRWTVLGASAAVVYDARRARVTPRGAPALGAAEVRMHLLPAGSTFDPRTGRAALPGHE